VLSCREVTERASDFLDRRLGFAGRLQMRLHLMICRACRAYLDQVRATIALLRTSRPAAAVPAAEAAVLEALAERGGEEPGR